MVFFGNNRNSRNISAGAVTYTPKKSFGQKIKDMVSGELFCFFPISEGFLWRRVGSYERIQSWGSEGVPG